MRYNTNMRARKDKRPNAAQVRAVKALRANIRRLDCNARRSKAGCRILKVWDVSMVGNEVVVESVAGWPRHSFDDISRVVRIGVRGGLSGFGNVGHGKAGDSRDCRGPRLLYDMDAQRIY